MRVFTAPPEHIFTIIKPLQGKLQATSQDETEGMAFWHKAGKKDGWLAIAPAGDGVRAAVVRRSAGVRPAVLACAFHPGKLDELAALIGKIGRELHATQHHCSSMLPFGSYQLLSLEAPNVPAAEMKTAVVWANGWRSIRTTTASSISDPATTACSVPPTAAPVGARWTGFR